jgi:hypothetical protein
MTLSSVFATKIRQKLRLLLRPFLGVFLWLVESLLVSMYGSQKAPEASCDSAAGIARSIQ